jgi:hypothetical protein
MATAVPQRKLIAMGKKTNPSPVPIAKYKKGGAVHEDVKEDKAMVKKMVKPSALMKKGGMCK